MTELYLVGVCSKELRMLLLNLGVRGGEAEVGGVAHAAVQLQCLLVQLVRLARGLEREHSPPYKLFIVFILLPGTLGCSRCQFCPQRSLFHSPVFVCTRLSKGSTVNLTFKA